MRYKVYYKGDRIKIYNTNVLYNLNMNKMSPSKHREEIEEYLENMDEPTLIDNGDGTVSLEFDPIPEEMATWIVNSKTTFFNVVRLSGGGGGHPSSRYKDKRENYEGTKHTVRDTFPYPIHDWKVRGTNYNISIPNTLDDRNNRLLSVEELTAGEITRNISYLNSFYIGCKSSDILDIMMSDGGWYKQFYIGLIYFDSYNIPTLYKMGKYDIIEEY